MTKQNEMPKPDWQTADGRVVLYNRDCMEVLPLIPARSVDVVTDPPYGMSLNTDNSRFSGGAKANVAKRGNGVGTGNGESIIGDDIPFDPSPLLKVGKEQIIWGWNHFSKKLDVGSLLVWIKRNDEAFGSFLSDAEIAWFSRGHGVYCRRDLSNNAVAKDRCHPTQKPLTLMEWCVEKVRGETILDPYMGSGTTGVACVRLGRGFIGCEISKRYFREAVRRIEAELSRAPLFEPPPIIQRTLIDAE